MQTKHVYKFSGNLAEGDRSMREVLGGKGANLHEMCKMGLPVPPGFTITTEASVYWEQSGHQWPEGFREQVRATMTWLEEETGKKFGDPKNPLLVSVRSGARVSMPGMMDTVLNLGLNDETVEGLAKLTNNRRFALDSYRRFIAMFGDVVLGLKPQKGEEDPFEHALYCIKKSKGVKLDTELSEKDLEEVVESFKQVILKRVGRPFATDPWEQLSYAVYAVFSSWMNERAIEYRRLYKIPSSWGTAVNVQTMVFGNMGDDSATGVAFTRNPATGEDEFYGEFLINAQGEDVVAGTRTPMRIQDMKEIMPGSLRELEEIRSNLEKHYCDMQDLEFTIERGKLYILQCRSGKRTALAALRIALEMLEENLIDEKTAITRIEADQIGFLLRPVFNADALEEAKGSNRLLAQGLPAGPGAASGRVCFYPDEVEERKAEWGNVILVRTETSPEDIKGMEAAVGILTSRGGMTSHAALVARQRGKTCISGCSEVEINYRLRSMTVSGKTVSEGDYISLDGFSGEIYQGEIPTSPSEVLEVLVHKTRTPEESPVYQEYARFMEIADKYRKLKIRTNSDQPSECEKAIAFGAQGVGLCRTEHMFFEGERINSMRKMILADTEVSRRAALEELLPYQRQDFAAIFRAMNGRPVTIRTIDPPLHEFLPHTWAGQKALAKMIGISTDRIKTRMEELHEENPMLGHRGCRLGITYPEITEMQARAIFQAASIVQKEGVEVFPEIMIPLVGCLEEFQNQEAVVRRVAQEVSEKEGVEVDYHVGAMIELPRAAVCADEIATRSEFFSFGTNDLTQTSLGMSRDDYGKFLPAYVEKEILKTDPFASIDPGVQRLIKIAVQGSREARPGMKLGICGEQGGDPDSITFCHQVGLDYVSCSPFRVPVARIAAAQAAIEEDKS